MRAIISVANRDGLPELARELQNHGVTIYSTSGTLQSLKAEHISAEAVSTLTQFPEILDGRVKTLHPAILGGILARRDNPKHLEELQAHTIAPIDIVVVNLYPFAETVAHPTTTLSEAQEQIDIGGVTLDSGGSQEFSRCDRTDTSRRLCAGHAGMERTGRSQYRDASPPRRHCFSAHRQL